MINRIWKNAIPLALLVAVAPAVSGAVEIQVRREAQPAGHLVRLGDVAKVYAEEPEAKRLSRIPLFPAPADGQQRFVRVCEIQDALDAHGVNLARCRFSGSSQVAVGQPRSADPSEIRLTSASRRGAQDKVQQAIADHLSDAAGNDGPWDVTVQLSNGQSRLLASGQGVIRASGGRRPWSGRQQFEIHLTSATGNETTTTIEAIVSAPQTEVVMVRALRRGEIIRARDVELRTRDSKIRSPRSIEGFDNIESVIGMETHRAISAGQIISTNAVRRPVLVRRGDVVTLYARAAGITIRTVARARDDGGQGELIEVESLDKDRKKFDVRVTGQGTADVSTLGSIATR